MNPQLQAIAELVVRTNGITMLQVHGLRAYEPQEVSDALRAAGLDRDLTEQLLFGTQLGHVFGPQAKAGVTR